MSDWPTERIWTDGHDVYTESYARKFVDYTEYIRADVAWALSDGLQQRITELERLLRDAYRETWVELSPLKQICWDDDVEQYVEYRWRTEVEAQDE